MIYGTICSRWRCHVLLLSGVWELGGRAQACVLPAEKKGVSVVAPPNSTARQARQAAVCLPPFDFDLAHHDAFPTVRRHAAPSYTLVASILLFPWPALGYCAQIQLQSSTPVIDRVHTTYVRYHTSIYTCLFCPRRSTRACNGAYVCTE